MTRSIATALLLAGSALSAPATAATTYADLDAWKAAVGSYSRDTAYGSDFSDIASLTLDDGTSLGFGSDFNIRGIGTGWDTWSGGYTGQVLYTNRLSSISVTLSPVAAFGFFVEPNNFGVYDFVFELSDGTTQSASYEGDSGAGFLGFVGKDISGFSVTTTGTDFAFGDFYTAASIASAPEPATWAMMIVGFGLAGAALRRRKPQVQATLRFA